MDDRRPPAWPRITRARPVRENINHRIFTSKNDKTFTTEFTEDTEEKEKTKLIRIMME
jgi:hypothetical protein